LLYLTLLCFSKFCFSLICAAVLCCAVLCCALLCLFLLYTSSSHISSLLGQLLQLPTNSKKRLPIQQPQVQKQTLESVPTTTRQHLLLLLFCYCCFYFYCYCSIPPAEEWQALLGRYCFALYDLRPLTNHSIRGPVILFPSPRAKLPQNVPFQLHHLEPLKRKPSICYIFFPAALSLDYS
jgi:hypothetical protein